MAIEDHLIDKCSRGMRWNSKEFEQADKIIKWREKWNIRD